MNLAAPPSMNNALFHPILGRALALAGLGALAVPSFAAAAGSPHELRLTVDRNGTAAAADGGAVSPDTPLRITFAAPPALGAGGKIQVFDAATNALVDSIDVGAKAPPTKTVGGEPGFRYYPVIIAGREADIYPRDHALGYGKTYYVTIDPGVFQLGAASFRGLSEPAAWRFTTKAAGPAPGATVLTVAADGSGDFCTVQGAIDFVPEGNRTPTTISIRRGTYTELVFFTGKHALTLVGEDRQGTVIAYANNERFNNPGGGINPYANRGAPGAGRPALPPAAPSAPGTPSAVGTLPIPQSAVGHVYHRGTFLAHKVDDLVLSNLSIRNTTPQGGSQSEAIILNGTPTARAILKDVDLYGYQDTLQINGQAYLSNCYIEGDVDFMWGTGPCFFDRCVCRALRSNAYYTQIRNPGTNHGYVYSHCTFDGLPGIMGNYLSRISGFPYSEVVLLDCQLTSAVGPSAWMLQSRTGGAPSNVHFWEFNSHDAAGKPVEVSRRNPGSRRLAQPADAELIANYGNPTFVLGGGWNPGAAPVFAAATPPAAAASAAGAPVLALSPSSQIALLGTDPSLAAKAAGSGPFAYQWSKNGTPLPGETAASLRFHGLRWDDAANYTVTATNAAGSVTSAPAQLTAVAPATMAPPKLPAIPETVFDTGAYGAVADGVTDNTAAIQRTIAAALAAGGGVVEVPAGTKPYLCGPLTLGSKIDLQIDHGATLQLLPYAAKTGPAIPAYPNLDGGRYADFISASNAHDVAVTGGGTIDGQGAAWWHAFLTDHGIPHRPFLIRFNRCNAVLVSGITLLNSPMFHVATSGTDNFTVFGITISAPISPNTDGVDPGGSHVLVQNCAIAVGDDNVVLKPGGTFCSDITVADCYFGIGHGMSVGGQTNAGLDGLTVKNCYFNGTTSGLRLKADSTQGGPLQNVTYTNMVMVNVQYPIVFYSYYKNVGSPGAVEGRLQSTPEKVKLWNAVPPNSLTRRTLPSWKHITINGLTATGTTGYSTIWGLPLAGYYWDDVKLNNVFISGGPGLEIYDASNVQFTGDTQVGAVTSFNALAITSQPRSQMVPLGSAATFAVTTAGNSGVKGSAPRYQWTFNGAPLADGARPDGTVVSGATTATLTLDKVQKDEAGKYAVTVSNSLDAYDVAAKALAPESVPVSATSVVATLNQAPPSRFGY